MIAPVAPQPIEPQPIELAQWYAAVGADWSGAGPLPAAARRVGGITVFHAGRGCETTTFGAGGIGAVVFDGYLFDRHALAEEIGAPADTGHAGLAALAYERWGSAVFEKLDGCYLLAIWDPVTRHLLLGHDGLGRHPAFYAVEGESCWFSSNVLALASSRRVATQPNRTALMLAMLRYWPDAGETYFRDIRRVRPGHYLRVGSSGDCQEIGYWDPFPEDDEPWLDDEQVLAEFEPRLMQAVDRCMALGAQGIMLSGGVDSVTVAALAAEYSKAHRTAPIVAVSGQTDDARSEEERLQPLVARALGMPHVVSTTREWTGGQDDVSLSLAMTAELPAPSDVYWVGTYTRFYRRTAGQRLRVLLTGSGGDNWLAVADIHAADLIRRLRFGQLTRLVQASVATAGWSLPSTLKNLLWIKGVRPNVDSFWARLTPERKTSYHRRKWHERLPPWLCPDPHRRAELIEGLLARRTPSLTAHGRRPASHYRHRLRWTANPFLHHEYETGYHIETACGLRLLSPYHDRRFVEFANRIAPRLLVHRHRYKGLLRPVVARHLPGLGLEGQRKEYSAEHAARELANLRRSVQAAWATCRFDALRELEVVTAGARAHVGDGLESAGLEALVRAFAMLNADEWVRIHCGVSS